MLALAESRVPAGVEDFTRREKEAGMLIRVIYPDNRYDFVKDTFLDQLIRNRSITMFQRKSGWVRVGVDPVRLKSRRATLRPEKGRSSQSPGH